MSQKTIEIEREVKEFLKNMESKHIPDDAFVMAVEEMVNTADNFNPSSENLELELETSEMMKLIKYYSFEEDTDELTEVLLGQHNNTIVLYINTESGVIFSVDAFFEFSPYGKSKVTLLAESIEKQD